MSLRSCSIEYNFDCKSSVQCFVSIMDVVRNCQFYFGFNLPSEVWSNRVKRFDVKYAACEVSFVNYGTDVR